MIMATVVPVLPTKGAKRFRDGCAKHWQLQPNPAERKLGIRKETYCRQGPAEARRATIRADVHRGTYLADDKTTVGEWSEKYLTDAAGRVRPSSLANILNSVTNWIVPGLGAVPMTAVRPDHVRDWARAMQTGTAPARPGKKRKKLSPRSAQIRVSTLHAMFELWRMDCRPLPLGNPVPRGVVKVPPKVRRDPLTVTQVRAWRDAAFDDMRAMMDVEAYYGARASEMLGLREEDLTWTGRNMSAPLAPQLARLAELPADKYAARRVRLQFREQLGQRRFNGNRSVRVPTKNSRAVRPVPVPQWLARVLAGHLQRWPVQDGWLFTNPRIGKGYSAPQPWNANIYYRWLRRAAVAAGVPLAKGQCSHALRHHCVSVLRDKGFSSQAIGEWIGDTALTVETTYGRPMPDSMDRIGAALDDARQHIDTRHGLRAV